MTKKIPVIKDTDVVVVGGGIAGISAALAAARLGANTILVEKETAPGGLATLGNIIVYLPICDGMGNQVIGGIGEELLHLSVSDGFNKIPSCWEKGGDVNQRKQTRFRVDFNPASFMLSMEELILKSGVDIWYDSRFCDVKSKNGMIKTIFIENKSGRVAINCKTVIDASGDADVCARSGESVESVKTNVESAWCFYFKDNQKTEPIKKTEEKDSENEERPRSSKERQILLTVAPLSKPVQADPRKPPIGSRGFAGDDGRDVSDLVIATHNMIREKIKDLQKKEKANLRIYPGILPLVPSLRMTRRLIGELEINEDDDGEYFEDCIGMTGSWKKRGPVYYIPYRSLVGVKNSNLISAGRCISSSGPAWDITRVIPVCAVTGEAAGTAAAIASKENEGNLKTIEIKFLQKQLLKQGVIINKRSK